jgi:DNA-binding GntR family transcriptional regulator
LSDQISTHTLHRSQEDYNIIYEANTGLHQIIYGAARSPRLTSLIALTVDVGVVAQTYYNYSETYFLCSAQHHNGILDVIAAHAPEWAESVISSPALSAASSSFPGKKEASK